MGLPRSPPEARTYFRVALQRFDEANALLRADFFTAAVYISGYSIECILKALVLSSATSKKCQELLPLFRGVRGHDIAWLKYQYLELSVGTIPKHIEKALLLANSWSTDLRYHAGATAHRDAQQFLDATRTIVSWADGRMGE